GWHSAASTVSSCRSRHAVKTGEACTLVRKCAAGPAPETKKPSGPYSARSIASRQRSGEVTGPTLRDVPERAVCPPPQQLLPAVGEGFHTFLFRVCHPGAYLPSTGTPFEDWIAAMSAPLRPRATAAPLVFPRTLAVGV